MLVVLLLCSPILAPKTNDCFHLVGQDSLRGVSPPIFATKSGRLQLEGIATSNKGITTNVTFFAEFVQQKKAGAWLDP